jgi:hypothetical protein
MQIGVVAVWSPGAGADRVLQASPHDPENFPFVVLGNKIDMEESKRMVSAACGVRDVTF